MTKTHLSRTTPHWRPRGAFAAAAPLFGTKAGPAMDDVAEAWARGDYAEAEDTRQLPGDIAFTSLAGPWALHVVEASGWMTPTPPSFAAATRRPRDREPASLPVCRIEIEHAGGVEAFDPTSLIMAFVRDPGRLAALPPVAGLKSMLSGAPAYAYCDDDVVLHLTMDEIAALAGTELLPREAVRIAARKGVFFAIHDDFYCDLTWRRLQPKGLRRDFAAASALAPAP